jgi:inorganic pyrophosphatase
VRNDRIIGQAVPKEAPTELGDLVLTQRMVSQMEFFFKAYKKAYGKRFKVLGVGNAKKAIDLMKRAVKEAEKQPE